MTNVVAWSGDTSAVVRTRTAPAVDAVATLNFAIASCQRYEHGHYAAWRHLAGEGLDLVMFLGDYIYEYPSPADALRPHEGMMATTLGQYRARYAQYKSDPLLQAAHAAAPWALVGDDHEIENDYAGLLGQPRDGPFAARRAAAYRAYKLTAYLPLITSGTKPLTSILRWSGRTF